MRPLIEYLELAARVERDELVSRLAPHVLVVPTLPGSLDRATRDRLRVVDLEDAMVRVGRAPRCEVNLGDPSVANLHIVLEPDEGRWQIADRDSGKVTRVNGDPVGEDECILASGDVIGVGDYELLFFDAREFARFLGFFGASVTRASL
jgi:pSer/pThr/pTyr-binding forkhead associated (FHA) protein